MPSQRDLRIDVFRGVALLIVVVDHIEGWSGHSVLRSWTLRSLGYSDAAEIFVFLSGYVFAQAYRPVLDRDGLLAGFKKAFKRTLQIYLVYLLASWAIIGTGALLLEWQPPLGHRGWRIGQHAGESVLAALTLRFQPWGFPILSFYVLVLPVAALLLYLIARRRFWLAWVLSGGAYITAQCIPSLTLHRFADGKPWNFNPLAWQFLFFLGICLGSTSRRPTRPVFRVAITLLAVVVLAHGLCADRWMPNTTGPNSSLTEAFERSLSLGRSWAGKPTLEPVRIVHFFALAYLASSLLPGRLAFWSTRLARPVVVCGQQSLEVYGFGLVLAFLAAFAISKIQHATVWVLSLDLAACLLSIGFAFALSRWRRSTSIKAMPASDLAL